MRISADLASSGRSADGQGSDATCFFASEGYRPLTPAVLERLGLPSDQLAAVALTTARVTRAGKWHLMPADPGPRCPQLLRTLATGRALTRREFGILSGFDLCGSCAARLDLPGSAGGYLRVARWLVAASTWVTDLERAARSADWLVCARWTAQTPFCDDKILTMIRALGAEEDWADYRLAAEATWHALRERTAQAASLARQLAGQPGLRAYAAGACAMVGSASATHVESQLIDSIPGRGQGQPWRYLIGADAWRTCSQAWLATISLDADAGAARSAMLAAMEDLYGEAPVRDVSLLPARASSSPVGFSSPASWAKAEYRLLRKTVVTRWWERLEDVLTELQNQAHKPVTPWRLLGVSGWPITEERDRELAYLTYYPELGRRPSLAPGGSREHRTWTVVLHVPEFAALHAMAHESPHLRVIPGPSARPGARPDPAEVGALLRRLPAILATA